MRSIVLIIFWTSLLIACSGVPESDVLKYYPEPSLLNTGVVNKYYETYTPANPDAKSRMDISYSLLQRTSADQFKEEMYNPGFYLTRILEYSFTNSQLFTERNDRIFGADTTRGSIQKSLAIDWSAPSIDTTYVVRFEYDSSRRYQYEARQLNSWDSIVLERPAKVFRAKWEITDLNSGEVVNTSDRIITYVQGFGMFHSISDGNSGTWETELVEQLPIEKFRKLADHGRHRVAYIDPANTLDDHLDFKLCGHELEIADYYNSTPRGKYAGEKREMLDIIFSKLDRSKLFNESGYLTIRFVVNCNGEAGRFTTELADLDFQEKSFPQETIDHLFQILYELDNWSPCVIRGEARDAYFYITFKLKDGEITDILP